nr:unnamed protein product [Callosobruchus analis]
MSDMPEKVFSQVVPECPSVDPRRRQWHPLCHLSHDLQQQEPVSGTPQVSIHN